MPRKYTTTIGFGSIGGNITTTRSDLAEVYKNLVTNHTRNRNITTKGLNSKRPGTRIINKLADTFNPLRVISWYKNIDENYLINFYKNADNTDIGMIVYKKTGKDYKKLEENYSKDVGQTIMSKYAAQALISADVRKIQVLPYNDTMYITTGSSFPLQLSKDADEKFTLNMWTGTPPMIQKPNAKSTTGAADVLVEDNLIANRLEALQYVREIPEDIKAKEAEGETAAVEAQTFEKTIKIKETATAPYWELEVVDAEDDDIVMAPGFYVFDWYSPPNAVTTFRNSLVFGGSKLNSSTIWASLPQKFNSFIINGKGIETVALAEVFTLDTTLEVLTLVAVEDWMIAFTRQETFFIDRNLEARKQSGNGASDEILPVLNNKDIYVVNNENELIVWFWSGEINGGWQNVNLTQRNDIDLITGSIVNLAGFRYVDTVSAKRASYERGYYNASSDELIQVNYNNIMVLTEERLVGLNIIGTNILVNGEWEIEGSEILDITSDYTNLYAQLRTSEGTYLVEFNKDFDSDFSVRAAGETYEHIITNYDTAKTPLTLEEVSGDDFNIDVGESISIQAKYGHLGQNITFLSGVDGANVFGTNEQKFQNVLTREQDNPLLGKIDPIRFDLGFYNLEVVLEPRQTGNGSYVWKKEVLSSTLVANIYQRFDLYIRDKSTGFGGKLGGSFNIKYDNLQYNELHTKDARLSGDIYPVELLFGIVRTDANKIGVVFGSTRGGAVGFTEQAYRKNSVAMNTDNLESLKAYKYHNYDVIFITVFYTRIIAPDKTAIIEASDDTEYLVAFVDILNNDSRRTTYDTIITADTIVPEEININTIIDVVPPTVNIAVQGNVNREYIPYIIKGVNINIVHSDGIALVKHKGGVVSTIKTSTLNKDDYFGGSKRLQRTFQFKQGVGGNTARFRTLPFYSIEHNGRGKFIISDYTADLEV